VLDNVNLNINKNDKIVIKGVSGSGKSTLIKLICGFYTPTQGDILINNVSIKEINIEHLRSQITMLNQNVKLFNISVYDNIRYINNTLTDDTINKFIKNNKIKLFNRMNLKNIAGQNGNNLSGGQKQMTLIFRCLLADKNILIFDEPTSALDNYHFDIFNSLIQNMEKTIIVITHDSRFDKSYFNNRFHLEKGILTKESIIFILFKLLNY
jgi:ABC-type bacteriocin/lantibiotic exporter with double-glycine peptidase domain